MKITAVEAIPFAIPYVKPLKFASGEVHTADHVLVRVHTDDGVVGVAEAPPMTDGASWPTPIPTVNVATSTRPMSARRPHERRPRPSA